MHQTEKEIEKIAMRFLEQREPKKRKERQDSSITEKDVDIYGHVTSSSNLHSRTRSKVLSIISNNQVLAECRIEFFQTKKVTLYQVPQKRLEDENDNVDGDEMSNVFQINENKDLKTIFSELNANYQLIYECMCEFYFPLRKVIENFDNFRDSVCNIITIIENYISHQSIFELDTQNELIQFKLNEIIIICSLVYLCKISLNLHFDFCNVISLDVILEIFQFFSECFKTLYDSIMLIVLLVSNNNTKEEEKDVVSYEQLIIEKVNEYYGFNFNPSEEEIIPKIEDNLIIINENLIKLTELIRKCLYESVNNVSESGLCPEYIEEMSFFENSLLMLKENKSEKTYEEIRNDVHKIFEVLNNMVNQSKIPIPYLPPLDKSKYKYTLVLDLDETLVHYVEEEEKAYVQVRPYAEYFLNEMGKLFEIVIFTAAAEDYADIVLKELDKSNSISYKLYRNHTNQKNGVFLKDLSKLGRDISKVCIIDNNKENFSLQPENGLHISSFLGDKNDNELFSLCEDLNIIITDNYDNIQESLKTIRSNMEKRYEVKMS